MKPSAMNVCLATTLMRSNKSARNAKASARNECSLDDISDEVACDRCKRNHYTEIFEGKCEECKFFDK